MKRQRIIVSDYDPKWVKYFERLKSQLRKYIGDADAEIEHVGSTSVPGLAAKPVIDIDIIPADEKSMRRVCAALSDSGYTHAGDMGIPGREMFKKEINSLDSITHNLYVCSRGCDALQNHLELRDYLRNNPDKAVEYGKIKKKLAEEFPFDIDTYVEGKTVFIVSVLKDTGFSDNALCEIVEMNKKK